VTREELITEIRETRIDLNVLVKSRDVIHGRLLELEGKPRHEELLRWPLMQVLINTYIAAIVRCEGLIEDYTKLLQEMEKPDNVLQLKKVES